MTTTEKLYEAVKDLPEPIVAELLDFAEFLRNRNRPWAAPPAHGELLSTLQGGLENSATFADDPLTIQERLRHEWN
jgi:hypothetical protein